MGSLFSHLLSELLTGYGENQIKKNAKIKK